MWLPLLLLAQLAWSTPLTEGPLGVDVAVNGSFTISINQQQWFSSSHVAFRHSGQTFSTANETLKIQSISPVTSGQGILGRFRAQQLVWVSTAGNVSFVTSFQVYEDAIIFEQHFPQGANDTSLGETQQVKDEIISAFPSFQLTSGLSRGFCEWSHDMTGSGPVYGIWEEYAPIRGGIDGTGPLAVFTRDLNTTVVISSFNSFMSQSLTNTNNSIQYGLMGSVKEIPVGYRVQTILSLGTGVNSAMVSWGDKLLKNYGKTRQGIEKDITLQYLGYSTDNGAYYYYNYSPRHFANYQEMLIALRQYADRVGLPYKWILLDSWWYYKGWEEGVKEWLATPFIFPRGLDYVYNATGWAIQGHNRYWATNNVYAKQNGGKWDFVIEKDPSKRELALPLQQEFWDWFLESSVRWGLRVYEQDWLDDQFDGTNYLLESATTARTWLMQMGTAAANNGLSIQYCMSHCRHIMQSVEIPAVTQARASGDYAGEHREQWRIGQSSLFAYSLGIAPSKDNYWSQFREEGAPYAFRYEPSPRLQSVVSSFSAGPVAPSDAINMTNIPLVLRACAADGRLLRPDKPATAIDAFYSYQAFRDGANGEVWSTFTDLGVRFSYVLSVNLMAAYNLTIKELGYGELNQLVAYEANTTTTLHSVTAQKPLPLRVSDKLNFQVFTLAPILSSGWALLGQADKWVPVSKDRFGSLVMTSTGFSVRIKGSPKEEVSVSVRAPNQTEPFRVLCVIGSGSVNLLECSTSCQCQAV
eukprot:m.78605 g.78605  ORF g.78605 m.78605 type:complete len:753 (+) comp20774_c0_seq2:47-2305(+)